MYLHVKRFILERCQPRARAHNQDHVDGRLEEICGDLPDLDLDVEGIVERIQGIERRLRLVMEDTLDEHGLSYGEWKLLCKLRRAPARTSTPGELSASLELSSGAMTNRIDRLERERPRPPPSRSPPTGAVCASR